MISVTSSTTPGREVNSCWAPEIRTEDAAEAVANGVTEACLKGLGDELGVGFGGGGLVFDETIRNFKRSECFRHDGY
jgi:hypothetical protein